MRRTGKNHLLLSVPPLLCSCLWNSFVTFHVWPCNMYSRIHFAAQTWFLWPQGRAGENNNVSPATLRWENRNINTAEHGSLYSGSGFKDGGGSVGCREHQMPQLFLWPNPLPAPVTLSFFLLCPPPWLAIIGSHYSMFWPYHLLIMVFSWIQLADPGPKLKIKITNWA